MHVSTLSQEHLIGLDSNEWECVETRSREKPSNMDIASVALPKTEIETVCLTYVRK